MKEKEENAGGPIEVSMPAWLLKKEDYEPPQDKDTFIKKSILTFLGLLSYIRSQSDSDKHDSKIQADYKVLFTFFLVCMVSASRNFAFVVVVVVGILAALSMLSGEKILKILRIAAVMTFFTLLILIPSLIKGNFYTTVMLTSKVFASVVTVNILSQTTPWNAITRALKTFFVPDLFIFVLDITMKYIVLLGEFSLNMLYALKLRSVGKNREKSASVAGIGGNLFIKSKEMAEEMHSAMECRGFTGEYSVAGNWKFGLAEGAMTLLFIATSTLFVYLERMVK